MKRSNSSSWGDAAHLETLFEGTFHGGFYKRVRDLLHEEAVTGGNGGRASLDRRWSDLEERLDDFRSPSPTLPRPAALPQLDAAPPGGDTNDNFVTKPARNLTSGDNTIHLLCVRTGSGSRVTYRTLTGPLLSPMLFTVSFVSVSAYSAPPDAPSAAPGVQLDDFTDNPSRPAAVTTDSILVNEILSGGYGRIFIAVY